jgi:hypothetical protein
MESLHPNTVGSQDLVKIRQMRSAIDAYRLGERTLQFSQCEITIHPAQRPLDQDQVDKLTVGFRTEGISHVDPFLAVFDDDPANLPPKDGPQTVKLRIKIFSGQHRYKALLALDIPEQLWWPIVLFSRGMSVAWITGSH